MRHFGDTVLQIYLFIALFSGAIGLAEVASSVLGWEQMWYSVFVGLFSFLWFIATFFIISLFRKYRVKFEYYVLPIFYLVSFASLSISALLVSLLHITWAWLPIFFLSASFIASLIEVIMSTIFLGKLARLKRKIKQGEHKLSL